MVEFTAITPEIAAQIGRIVGEKHVVYLDAERLEPFGHDETPGSEAAGVLPELVAHVQSTEEVAAIMKLANLHHFPVTPRGAGSGLSGGAVPAYGGVVLCFDRMNRVLDYDPDNMTITVEPGMVTSEINLHAAADNLFYAGYPMSLETCFIGGNVAENAGGGKAVKYGVTSRYVLGLTVVTPQGEVVRLGGKLSKDVTGYNLIQLMVGSEGTLGIFTEIILHLMPVPRAQLDLLCLFPTAKAAIELVPKLIAGTGVVPTAIEFMDRSSVKLVCEYLKESIKSDDCGAMLLISVDGVSQQAIKRDFVAIGEFCEQHGAQEIFAAATADVSERLWRIRRNINEACDALVSDIQRAEDIVVPPAEIARMVEAFELVAEKYGVSIISFGHAGDGNLHTRIIAPPKWDRSRFARELPKILDEVYTLVQSVGGKLTGEHGVGLKLKKYLPYVITPEHMALMRAVKNAFDPNGILNPGKIF